MSKDLSTLSLSGVRQSLQAKASKVKRYLPLLVFILVASVYSLTVYEINRLVASQPSDDAVAEKLQSVSVPKIDEKTVTAIQNLEDQNIQTQTIFNQARQNPFAE